ncbi:uncharacterized protein LOC62_02G003332 [Vanrija pseudolonga]|uniref:LysM domain-containing protein n=1 Tax=Vanrija pseudolonga TaxID=143232 RepID=A0AAF0Y5N7_9TREE|nr:hypothetical protein LOC62_02G003332 [Vanrija pseudolonga]
MATAPTYCQTCSSELRPTEERYTPACCNVPICGACVARNPRLKAYSPCLRCGDVRTRDGAAEVARGAARREEDARRVEEVFVLEDSDDEGEGEGEKATATPLDEPTSRPPQPQAPAVAEAQAEQRVVEIKHLVSRGDTLQSIARKYATDPHALLALNNLPHAALYANPAILRTRVEIVISRRTVTGTSDEGDDEDGAERRRQRALKRFQVVSKEVDRGVAGAYLALAEEGEGSTSGEGGEGREGGWGTEKKGGEKATKDKEKGASPRSALDAYFSDEEWERAVPRPAKGKVSRWTVVGAVLPPGAQKA